MIVSVTFTLNEGCTQTVDWSNLPKGTNLVKLANEWKQDLHAVDFKIEKEKSYDSL